MPIQIKLAPGVLALALALAACGPAGAQNPPASPGPDLPVSPATIMDQPGVPFAGALDGDVTVVEFLDFNCPYCKKVHPEVQSLIKADKRVRVLYKDWPIFGEASVYAAQVAIASGWQDKYLQVNDAFLRSPVRLSDKSVIRARAKTAGVDLARLDRDLVARADEIKTILARTATEAAALGLQGTPAFLIGTYVVPGGLPQSELEKIVKDVRGSRSAGVGGASAASAKERLRR